MTNKANITQTDKVYKLKNGQSPLSFTLPSRNTKRYPLMWFDEEKNINKPLRYARNQKSPFEDEQDGNAILEPIVFEDGQLVVPRTNPVLQQFLHFHPLLGIAFELVDHEADAKKESDALELEVDALIEARSLTVEQLETMSRVMFGKDPSLVTTAVLRRVVIVFAKKDPISFMDMLKDPELKYKSDIHKFFDANLLTFRNGNKEVWFNTPTNKKKMMSVPYGQDPYDAAGSYLRSDEGLDSLKMLETIL